MKRMEKYIVGGFVRDKILGKPSNDIDYVVIGETVESMLQQNFKLVGSDFPVFLHPETGDEYALARVERKIGKGYNGFSCYTENILLEDDLGRRDLTINAIAMSENGEYIDPFNGIKDIQNKVLRHTTVAFSEDPLRVLRLARFTARFIDFTIADETKKLAKSLREELKYLTPERVFKELEKTLKSEKPSNYFRNLLELDALDIVHPEIYKMIGVEQRFNYHAEGDVFEHTMRVLDQVCLLTDDVLTRYAALYHDIGKPLVDNGSGSFPGHESYEVISKEFAKLKSNKHPNAFINIGLAVAEYHTFIHTYTQFKKAGKIVKRIIEKRFPYKEEDFERLLTVSLADERGRILGNRKLSKNEVDIMYSGGKIDGFEFRENTEHYDEIREVFVALRKKVNLPSEVIEAGVFKIKEFIYDKQLSRVKSIKRKNR